MSIVSAIKPQVWMDGKIFGITLTGISSMLTYSLLSVIGGIIYFLLLYAAGESLHLQLALEENTRLTAALLLRMHQESHQSDPRAPYSGSGFASDPCER